MAGAAALLGISGCGSCGKTTAGQPDAAAAGPSATASVSVEHPTMPLPTDPSTMGADGSPATASSAPDVMGVWSLRGPDPWAKGEVILRERCAEGETVHVLAMMEATASFTTAGKPMASGDLQFGSGFGASFPGDQPRARLVDGATVHGYLLDSEDFVGVEKSTLPLSCHALPELAFVRRKNEARLHLQTVTHPGGFTVTYPTVFATPARKSATLFELSLRWKGAVGTFTLEIDRGGAVDAAVPEGEMPKVSSHDSAPIRIGTRSGTRRFSSGSSDLVMTATVALDTGVLAARCAMDAPRGVILPVHLCAFLLQSLVIR